ncbi:MAG: 50S ribosomal protein L10 [Planctomycetes bacterium]|nr:50S ribosomal protein L10 [Planctomycetota bacterium]
MPNLVNRLVIKELQSELGKAEGMVIVGFGGLTVKESEALRNALAKKGATLSLVRNSLARLVLAERGFEVTPDMLAGNTAIAYGDAEAAIHASKMLQTAEVKKANKVQIRGGVLEGKLLNAKDAIALADVPDRKTLNGKLVSLLVSGPRSLAMLLSAVPSAEARLLQARADQLEKSGGAAPAS